jgi:hypothetical protein
MSKGWAGADVGQTASPLVRESVMSKADQFRQNAEEAMDWACNTKNETQKAMLIELARAWARAAARHESPAARHDHAA